MKLVIDIPYGHYLTIKDGHLKDCIKATTEAIAKGTPLPKGCGRLIDARAYEQSVRKHYFDNRTVIRCTEIALLNAPTIIEADKVESGEKK